jgi:hypothetical protein
MLPVPLDWLAPVGMTLAIGVLLLRRLRLFDQPGGDDASGGGGDEPPWGRAFQRELDAWLEARRGKST